MIPDVYVNGITRRSTQNATQEILRNGRVIFKFKGTTGQLDDIMVRLSKLSDNEIERLRKLSDEDFSKYLDDLARLLASKKKKLSKTAIQKLTNFAQKLRSKKNKRPSSANVIEGPYLLEVAQNLKGLNLSDVIEGFHPLVREWVKNALLKKDWIIPDHHGMCSEIVNVSKILWQVDRRGIMGIDEAKEVFKECVSYSIKVRGAESLKHGAPLKACDTCNPFLHDFGITEIKTINN